MKKNQVGKSFTAQQNQMWPELGSFSAIQKSRNCKFNFLRNTKMERRKMLSQLTLKRYQRCESVIFWGKIWNVFVDSFYVLKGVFRLFLFILSSSYLACVSMGWFGLNVFGVEWLQMPLFFSYSREPIRDGQKRERNPVLNFQLDPAHTNVKVFHIIGV